MTNTPPCTRGRDAAGHRQRRQGNENMTHIANYTRRRDRDCDEGTLFLTKTRNFSWSFVLTRDGDDKLWFSDRRRRVLTAYEGGVWPWPRTRR